MKKTLLIIVLLISSLFANANKIQSSHPIIGLINNKQTSQENIFNLNSVLIGGLIGIIGSFVTLLINNLYQSKRDKREIKTKWLEDFTESYAKTCAELNHTYYSRDINKISQDKPELYYLIEMTYLYLSETDENQKIIKAKLKDMFSMLMKYLGEPSKENSSKYLNSYEEVQSDVSHYVSRLREDITIKKQRKGIINRLNKSFKK
jgi:uncharacterized membrane protein YgaE (UPF0421/DUF939 family)